MPKATFDAQILSRHLRWGKLAATAGEDFSAPRRTMPAVPARKFPTFLQLQAQRRNVLRSTGPRTAAGKRRAALNSAKWQLCSKAGQLLMALEGRDPFAYRRLHRQLTFWFAPSDPYSRRMVADLAGDWWEKLNPRKAGRAGNALHYGRAGNGAGNSGRRLADAYLRTQRRVEYTFGILIDLLAARSRKWKYLLGKRVGLPITENKSGRELVRELEKQLKVACMPALSRRVPWSRKSRINIG